MTVGVNKVQGQNKIYRTNVMLILPWFDSLSAEGHTCYRLILEENLRTVTVRIKLKDKVYRPDQRDVNFTVFPPKGMHVIDSFRWKTSYSDRKNKAQGQSISDQRNVTFTVFPPKGYVL